jgi:hypothetical protein
VLLICHSKSEITLRLAIGDEWMSQRPPLSLLRLRKMLEKQAVADISKVPL